jgi:hypothetical protein
MRAATEIITWLAIESKLYYALLLVGGLGAAVVIWRYVFQEI